MVENIAEGYKKTEVGIIPEDWEVRTFGELFNFNGGISASRDQLSLEGLCYLHYGDIHKSTKTFIDVSYEFSILPKLDIPKQRVSKNALLNDGDIVFVDASEDDEGASKHIIIRNKDNIPFISGLHTIVSKAKNALLDNLYKEFCFQSDCIKRQFKFYSAGTKVCGVSKGNIVKMLIPIPPLQEQQAIATALSDIDGVINSLTKLIDKKKNIKQGAMQELLTGKKRLDAFSGEREEREMDSICNVESISEGYKKTEIGVIPEDWECVELGEVVEYVKGYPFRSKDYRKNGIRIIRVSDTTLDSIKDENAIYIAPLYLEKYSNWKLVEDDIIVSTVGSKPPMYDSLVGKPILVKKDYAGSLLNQNAVILRSKARNQKLIYANLIQPNYIRYIEMIFRGNANQASITLNELFEFKFAMPKCINEQAAIAQILSDMDTEIEKLNEKLTKYKEIKQGMMQELLTGKRRLIHND